jgi:signal transduction histidine kinase
VPSAVGSESRDRSADPGLVLSADSPAIGALYAGVVLKDVVRSLWDEPRAPNPPPQGWEDWALVGVLGVFAIGEALFRPDLVWRPLALLLGAGPLLTLLWRRSHPLVVVIIAFGTHAAVNYAPIFGHHHADTTLYASAFVLLLPYTLLRWGSGREALIGTAFILGSHLVIGPGEAGLVEYVAGIAILLLPAALGASVRYRSVSHVREIDQVKLREREQLARELHDTVAHHVSAIAIQAQAGRAVAATDPASAVEVLKVIEAEASRTLAEMRTMVGALRHGEEPALAPQRGIADIALLAERSGGPVVEVAPTGDLGDLTPSIDAAVYRLAQESITNALRHARRATRIRVAVAGEPDVVRLTVSDDGEASSFGTTATAGYGIVGMTERATLLGGTLHAGPNHDRGWTVTAVLPRAGATT